MTGARSKYLLSALAALMALLWHPEVLSTATLVQLGVAVKPDKLSGSSGTFQPHEPTEVELDRFDGFLNAADLIRRSDPATAMGYLRKAMAIYENAYGPNHSETVGRYYVIAFWAFKEGWYEAAEYLIRHALTIQEKVHGIDSSEVAKFLNLLTKTMIRQHKYSEAELFQRRGIAILEKESGSALALALRDLGEILFHNGRHEEAEVVLLRSLHLREFIYGKNDTTPINNSLLALGKNYMAMHRYEDAERVLTRAAMFKLGQYQPLHVEALTALGMALDRQGKQHQARVVLQKATAAAQVGLEYKHLYHLAALSTLGHVEHKLGAHARAVALFRQAFLKNGPDEFDGLPNKDIASYFANGATAFFAWAGQGGGPLVADKPSALNAIGFEIAQVALTSAAGDALADFGTRTWATLRGGRDAGQSYKVAVEKQTALAKEYASTFSQGNRDRSDERADLLERMRVNQDHIDQLLNRLRTSSPIYFDLQMPRPVQLSALQARTGPNASLLTENEALVFFMIPPGKEKGWVVAINKDRYAVAEVGLSGDQLGQIVRKLRGQIDPKGYGNNQGSPGSTKLPAFSFDRHAAFTLHQALLGDVRIAEVIAAKPNLIFVPSGPLLSLPPAVLVTAKPQDGPAGDTDPATLRKTAWLLRSKSISVLPQVASLRVLRQLLPQSGWHYATADPLVAFGDPDFAGEAYRVKQKLSGITSQASQVVGGTEGFFHDGLADPDARKILKRLPGTRHEVLSLSKNLNAPEGSVHLWGDASETTLRRLQATGVLARARIVLFATHGLLTTAQTARSLGQPALALAAPSPLADPKLDDGLLTATEVASLEMNADWVILSACNTAAPDRSEVEGLSGLMRAFFVAGARAVLVSHWRVQDEEAALLIPSIIARYENTPRFDKAQALRSAMIAVLDDTSHDELAFPTSWAPFVLVGDSAR